MSLATLSEVLQAANRGGYAVTGCVCLGWEDMRAYVTAAELEEVPVILQAGPSCRAHTPLPVLGAMFRHLAESASVPVVAHLDHGANREECRIAIESGFTSVMYDGSRLDVAQNIAETAAIAEMAHAAGVSCEGEIGFVGYSGGEQSAGTDPEEAARFARETAVDAMAVSVGNLHLQEEEGGDLDEPRLSAIEALTDTPLVIHGGSGVPLEQRRRLAKVSTIAKFNIGTEFRMVFGAALRAAVTSDPIRFDRVQILKETHDPLVAKAREVFRVISKP